jgi:hypothetical protein
MLARKARASRRDVLRKLCAAIGAAAAAPWRTAAPGSAQPSSGIEMPSPSVPAVETEKTRFFSAEEKEMIATVADLIIPTDAVSPGARAAGVHDWIDFLVANSPSPVQERWRAGLAALDYASEGRAGRKFLALELERQRKLLEEFAQREDAPLTPAERFFVLAKEATVNGYYTSEIGLMKDLRYQGDRRVAQPDTSCPGPPAKRAAQVQRKSNK